MLFGKPLRLVDWAQKVIFILYKSNLIAAFSQIVKFREVTERLVLLLRKLGLRSFQGEVVAVDFLGS